MAENMKGKVVVITGATSGIGQVAAEKLAAMGARIVQVARDRERGQAAMVRLNQVAPGISHAIYYADLSRLREMKRVAAEIAQAEPRIDVLINNAGAMFGPRELTEDGLERTFALNHMSYFMMTQGLRDRLAASAPARVVNTASDAHTSGTVDFDDLQSEKAYQARLVDWVRYGGPAFKVYARSKLMKDIESNAEIMELLLPTLRADINISETYRYVPEEPLDCPIMAVYGTHDPETDNESVLAWQRQTRKEFCTHNIPGDHFFLNSSRRILLRHLSLYLKNLLIEQRPAAVQAYSAPASTCL